MDILICTDKAGGTARLTTESAASSYGIPVLRVDAQDCRGDFGPADAVGPTTAAAIVAGWAAAQGRTAEEVEAARLYLAQWPDGPQL